MGRRRPVVIDNNKQPALSDRLTARSRAKTRWLSLGQRRWQLSHSETCLMATVRSNGNQRPEASQPPACLRANRSLQLARPSRLCATNFLLLPFLEFLLFLLLFRPKSCSCAYSFAPPLTLSLSLTRPPLSPSRRLFGRTLAQRPGPTRPTMTATSSSSLAPKNPR